MKKLFLIALAVLAGDAASKQVVYHSMRMGQAPLPILGDWVRLTYTHNPGAAFSLFVASRWFFIGVSLLSIVVILSLALSGRYRDRWMMAAFGLILGGALGNLADRIWLGTVIDFVDVGVGGRRWPVFNVADMGVSVGVALLAVRLLFEGKRPTEDDGSDKVSGEDPETPGRSGTRPARSAAPEPNRE